MRAGIVLINGNRSGGISGRARNGMAGTSLSVRLSHDAVVVAGRKDTERRERERGKSRERERECRRALLPLSSVRRGSDKYGSE